MSKKHFFLYDFLLPLAGVLALGRTLSGNFSGFLFASLDGVRPFGLGAWFLHSSLRVHLSDYSWLIFAMIPALAWMIWVRLNLEQDLINGRLRLDRPIYTFFHRLAVWIEGGGEVRMVRQGYERRLAMADERIRRLEAQLAEAYVPEESFAPDADFEEGESYGVGESFDADNASREEWRDGHRPPAPPI